MRKPSSLHLEWYIHAFAMAFVNLKAGGGGHHLQTIVKRYLHCTLGKALMLEIMIIGKNE